MGVYVSAKDLTLILVLNSFMFDCEKKIKYLLVFLEMEFIYLFFFFCPLPFLSY